ncbi:MAG: hypothetical protein IJM78_04595 [Prevotella sp.]|nr:hypothetical protein [Prevotella sp.]
MAELLMMMEKRRLLSILFWAVCLASTAEPIDRKALLQRNNPVVTRIDALESLSVGNGDFAFTVDATGLQTFPQSYAQGVPLGTMSNWGWHYAPNVQGYNFREVLEEHDFGHGHKELYAGQKSKAADYFRSNPHRLHLGTVGFYGIEVSQLSDIRQELRLEQGEIVSQYKIDGNEVKVQTECHPTESRVAVRIQADRPLPLLVQMPFPTGGHSDDACDWTKGAAAHHTTVTTSKQAVQMTHVFPKVVFPTEFDTNEEYDASYHFGIASSVPVTLRRLDANRIVVIPKKAHAEYILDWNADVQTETLFESYQKVFNEAAAAWHRYWYDGAMVDFSRCKDGRAKELERRVVLSQYLLAVNSGGEIPPQETGLTYNSWFGKFHLEMLWWHQAQFALWGHPEKLQRTLEWFNQPQVKRTARWIAQRQGFKGLRWMKMTDRSGLEAPSKVGSFLIWQQPHLIHLAELLRRAGQPLVVNRFGDLVEQTAQFMADFTSYDEQNRRYVLKGYIPAQETLRAKEVQNSPYELSQWHLTLQIAQEWRLLQGKERDKKWDDIVQHLAPLAHKDNLYLAAETAPQTYSDSRFTQDHMAVLGALGIFPAWRGIDDSIMENTLRWIQDNWHWDHTWGWDHPMTAMCAARLGKPHLALKALLAPHRTNTYLLSGHNYQDNRLRIYLPGNGALLQAVALMCAGWDGCKTNNPGFPKDGNWDVQWEGLLPLP